MAINRGESGININRSTCPSQYHFKTKSRVYMVFTEAMKNGMHFILKLHKCLQKVVALQLQVTPRAAEENLSAVLLLCFTWLFVFQHCRILRSLHCNVLPSMCRSDSGNSRSLGWSASSHSNFQDACAKLYSKAKKL